MMTQKKRVAAMLLAVMASGIAKVDASSLRLTDVIGGTVVTVPDGSGADLSLLPGMVRFIGSVGPTWTVTSSVGTSHPFPTYTTANDRMRLNAMVTSAGAGDLRIEWSDTGFDSIAGVVGYLASIGGTLNSVSPGSTLGFTVWRGSDNVLFSHAGGVLSSLSFSGGGFGGMDMDPLGPSGMFSLTFEVNIHHEGAGDSSFDALGRRVPDGGATGPLLLVTVLGLFAFTARRKLEA